jgi:hypothetical protein
VLEVGSYAQPRAPAPCRRDLTEVALVLVLLIAELTRSDGILDCRQQVPIELVRDPRPTLRLRLPEITTPFPGTALERQGAHGPGRQQTEARWW